MTEYKWETNRLPNGEWEVIDVKKVIGEYKTYSTVVRGATKEQCEKIARLHNAAVQAAREEFEDGRFEVLSQEHVAGESEAEAVKGEHKLFEDFGVEYDDDCYVIRWESNDGRMDSLTAFKTGKIILTRSPFSGDFPPKSYTFDSLIAALTTKPETANAIITHLLDEQLRGIDDAIRAGYDARNVIVGSALAPAHDGSEPGEGATVRRSPVDRLPTREEAAQAAAVLSRCNGHDLDLWTGGEWPVDAEAWLRPLVTQSLCVDEGCPHYGEPHICNEAKP